MAEEKIVIIPKPLAADIWKAYADLFAAVENGLDTETFSKARETFRTLQDAVADFQEELSVSEHYRNYAYDCWHRDGELEIDPTAVVSLSDDGGAYVEAWLWVDDQDVSRNED